VNRLQRHIGPVGLLFVSLGGVIGSGWLFAALYAAQIAGPAAVVSWLIGGLIALVLALVYGELGAMLPVAGGLARFPHFTHGGLVSFVGGWLCWLGYVTTAPIEVLAVLEYLGNLLPWLDRSVGGERVLTTGGTAAALTLLGLFTVLNMIGVRLMSESNKVVTWWKIAVPLLAAIALLVAGFEPSNFTSHGFAPKGVVGIFAAVSTGGIMFSLFGFRTAIELAAEARDPQRDLPRALIGTVAICTVLYLLLQVAFVAVVPAEQLSGGWSTIVAAGASGPFAAFATTLGLGWLATLLYVDAVASPSGTALVFTGATARLDVAMSRNQNVPKALGRIDRRGVPVPALVVNYLAGAAMLLPVPGWGELVGIISTAALLAAGLGVVSFLVLRRDFPEWQRPFRVRAGTTLGIVSFACTNLVVLWSGWHVNRVVLGLLALGLVLLPIGLAATPDRRREMFPRSALWLAPYLAGLALISALSHYGDGLGWLESPWAELLIIAFGTAILPLAVRSAIPRTASAELMERALAEDGPDDAPPAQ
jgi:amino acid transporter